jgi:hypothetical protein
MADEAFVVEAAIGKQEFNLKGIDDIGCAVTVARGRAVFGSHRAEFASIDVALSDLPDSTVRGRVTGPVHRYSDRY